MFWAPRIIGICMAAFVSLFALDVFGEGYAFWETAAALMIHLVPTYVLIVALILAWRWEWLGAFLYIGLGAFYIIRAWGRFPPAAYLTISGPLFVAGVLFLANWLVRRQHGVVETATQPVHPDPRG